MTHPHRPALLTGLILSSERPAGMFQHCFSDLQLPPRCVFSNAPRKSQDNERQSSFSKLPERETSDDVQHGLFATRATSPPASADHGDLPNSNLHFVGASIRNIRTASSSEGSLGPTQLLTHAPNECPTKRHNEPTPQQWSDQAVNRRDARRGNIDSHTCQTRPAYGQPRHMLCAAQGDLGHRPHRIANPTCQAGDPHMRGEYHPHNPPVFRCRVCIPRPSHAFRAHRRFAGRVERSLHHHHAALGVPLTPNHLPNFCLGHPIPSIQMRFLFARPPSFLGISLRFGPQASFDLHAAAATMRTHVPLACPIHTCPHTPCSLSHHSQRLFGRVSHNHPLFARPPFLQPSCLSRFARVLCFAEMTLWSQIRGCLCVRVCVVVFPFTCSTQGSPPLSFVATQ